MSYQIKVWYDKNFITYAKAISELISLGFNNVEANKILKG